jgi:predicted HNH restriction endonuclease
VHRRAHFKRHYKKADLQHGVLVCRSCHRGIHREYDEMTLARQFNTLTALMGDETLSRHFEWVAKQREQ